MAGQCKSEKASNRFEALPDKGLMHSNSIIDNLFFSTEPALINQSIIRRKERMGKLGSAAGEDILGRN